MWVVLVGVAAVREANECLDDRTEPWGKEARLVPEGIRLATREHRLPTYPQTF